MRWILPQIPVAGIALPIILLFVFALPTLAQSTASIDGQVIDQHGAVLPGVKITVKCPEIGIDRAATSDPDGRYQFAALPVGDYSIGASADGFKTQVLEGLRIEVGRRITQDLQLEVGDVSEQVIVTSTNDAIERSTTSVGHVVDQRMVQELPLNGRYFLDLGLLVPGSVTS
ncbi:MAG TPA: carboxypeptidase-like regulatory domain-containing protein, partial [Pyrinomonadaceae bacterium]|nr:carboxypeptidase-like regulatory domain-containing protein [Pyrinomonadaceae bacterium]